MLSPAIMASIAAPEAASLLLLLLAEPSPAPAAAAAARSAASLRLRRMARALARACARISAWLLTVPSLLLLLLLGREAWVLSG
jgi:hypothetical protein